MKPSSSVTKCRSPAPYHAPLALFALLGSIDDAAAALFARAGGMVYDSDLDITWLADANYAMTEFAENPGRIDEIIATANAAGGIDGHLLTTAGITPDFDTAGNMTWWGAMAWAEQLHYGGYSDWRLPVRYDNSCGGGTGNGNANCTNSEMGHLFYTELGGTFGQNVTSSGDPDLALFSNIPDSTDHWSSTQISGTNATVFSFFFGYQGSFTKDTGIFQAWAVRDGDVAVAPVPPALWLFGSALAGLLSTRRRSVTGHMEGEQG